MRVPVPAAILVLLATALFASGCLGPDNPRRELAEACERQIAEIEEGQEHSDTPSAKSSDDRDDAVEQVECAGQPTGDDASSKGDEEGDGDGEGGEDAPSADDAPADDGQPTPVALDPAARATFVQACGTCHALSDAETNGSIGPNLDESTSSVEDVRKQIEEGGGGMPADILQGDEADAVAEYVAAAAAAEATK